MKVWESLIGRTEGRTDPSLGFQDWVDMFSFAGSSYPLLNTTWGNQDEESIIRTSSQAYHSNGPVFALVMARMQVFSQARFQWTRFRSGRPTDLFGSPELGILERPWAGGVTGDLLARMEVDVSQAGNSYTRRVRRGLGPTKVDRLNRLRPEWVTIVMGSQEDEDHPSEAGDVEVAGYIYWAGGNKRETDRAVFLLPNEVAHYAPIPDPNNNFLGMSWITPVIAEAAADDGMVLHKRKFMQNAATPNLSIKFDPSMTIDQVRQFKSLMEEEHQGVWNAYKTLYLGGGADVEVIGKDFKELDFSATQGKGESRLAAAAGVPPSWVGFSEGLQGSALNAGNFASARRRFGDGTMQHLWSNAAASLEPILFPPNGANLWYDTTGIPFLREDAKDAAVIQSSQAVTITQLVNGGFTADSAVKAVLASDWTLLVHTGLTSVQLQPPVDPNAPPVAPPTGPAQPPQLPVGGAKP
jgi:phage portal protein BeeE